jgi:hypothetical protein
MADHHSKLDVLELRAADRLVAAIRRGNRRWPWLGRAVVATAGIAVVAAFPVEAAIEGIEKTVTGRGGTTHADDSQAA